MARRRDWTPPRESGPKAVTEVDEETEICEAGRFGKLLCDYNYSGLDSDTRDIPLNIDGGGPTKRRRIEVCGKNFISAYLMLILTEPI